MSNLFKALTFIEWNNQKEKKKRERDVYSYRAWKWICPGFRVKVWKYKKNLVFNTCLNSKIKEKKQYNLQ